MNLNRVKAIILQELYITRNAYEIFFDIVVYPLMSIVVFGYLSLYLAGINNNSSVAQYILSGMLFWQVIFIAQYSVSVGSLWNIWSRNLSSMFVAPISVTEYISAFAFTAVLKGLILFLLGSVISIYLFKFNIFNLGVIPLTLYFINLVLFAFSLGIMILGLIFRFGTRIQSFAWGMLPFFQPLSAAFYPVDVIPMPFRALSYLLPPTFIFEEVRYDLNHHMMNLNLISIAFTLNVIYLIVSIYFFSYMFKKSKETGQFARNES